jgi:hypothetical protein
MQNDELGAVHEQTKHQVEQLKRSRGADVANHHDVHLEIANVAARNLDSRLPPRSEFDLRRSRPRRTAPRRRSHPCGCSRRPGPAGAQRDFEKSMPRSARASAVLVSMPRRPPVTSRMPARIRRPHPGWDIPRLRWNAGSRESDHERHARANTGSKKSSRAA